MPNRPVIGHIDRNRNFRPDVQAALSERTKDPQGYSISPYQMRDRKKGANIPCPSCKRSLAPRGCLNRNCERFVEKNVRPLIEPANAQQLIRPVSLAVARKLGKTLLQAAAAKVREWDGREEQSRPTGYYLVRYLLSDAFVAYWNGSQWFEYVKSPCGNWLPLQEPPSLVIRPYAWEGKQA